MGSQAGVAIFQRIIDPRKRNLSAAAARSLLQLDFAARDKDRMNALAAKARLGTLSAEEDEELEDYIYAGQVLAILQSKARQSLKKTRT